MSDNFVSPEELLKHFQKGHYYKRFKVDDKYFEHLLRLYPTEVRKRMISNKNEIIAQYKSFEDIEIILNGSVKNLVYPGIHRYLSDMYTH